MRSRALLTNLFDSCADAKSTAQLHSLLLRSGLFTADCFFATKLVTSYSQQASIELARKLFDETSQPNAYLWNSILRAHSRAKQWGEVLHLFRRMTHSPSPHHRPDAFTLPIALKACAGLAEIGSGRAIQGLIMRRPTFYLDMFVGAALIEMYAKCGEMVVALKVFEGFPEPDVVLWTSMVTGYQQNGDAYEAVSFFSRMVVEQCVVPDPVTLVSVLSALGQLGELLGGRCCHGFLLRMGFDSDLSLLNAVLNLYSRLGAVDIAKKLFEIMHEKDVITWSCMIACYGRNGNATHALKHYKRMVDVGLEPNSVTVVSVLQACALTLDLQEGRRLHEASIQKGFEMDTAVSTALIDMYMKCSSYDDAMDLFHRMPKKDVVSWAAVIGGCAQNGLADESLSLFQKMLLVGTNPDAVTVVKVLAACSQLGICCQALCVHGYVVNSGFDGNVYVGAALVDLYSKCGNLDDAIAVFESMVKKDVVLWSSMIEGYGIHGLGRKAIVMFEQMIKSSIRPNDVTFVSILSACSHAGLVDEGRRIYDSMNHVYEVTPNSEHCGIIVDMFGRSGHLDEALRLIEGMLIPASPHVWCALLSGCRIHQNVEMGELVARNLLKLEPDHVGYYNLLSGLYAFGGKWHNVVDVKSVTKDRRLRKTPGYSSIETSNGVHTFFAGEGLKLEFDQRILKLLYRLHVKIKEEGYVPGIPTEEGIMTYSFKQEISN